MSEEKSLVLAVYGGYPAQDENEEVCKVADVTAEGDEVHVKAMLQMEGKYGIYYMIYGTINQGVKPMKMVCPGVINKAITGRINTDRDFKVPFTMKITKGVNPAGQPYTACALVD